MTAPDVAALTEQVRADEAIVVKALDSLGWSAMLRESSDVEVVRAPAYLAVRRMAAALDALAEALAQTEKERDALQDALEDISSKMRCADGCDAIARAALALAAGRDGGQ